ncbi:MAG: hypothetical protein AAF611_04470 [Bacteroidota bacterium]
MLIACISVGFAQVDLGDDVLSFEGEFVILDVTTQNATSYEWTLNGQVLINQTAATLAATQSGLYGATALINGTPSSVTVQVTFNPVPVIGTITDFVISSTNGQDFGVFDLSTKIPEITNGDANLTVTFYESFQDALGNSNPIVAVTNYVNITNPQLIFVRVEDVSTGCSSIDNFTIEVQDVTVLDCSATSEITTYCYMNNDPTQFVP